MRNIGKWKETDSDLWEWGNFFIERMEFPLITTYNLWRGNDFIELFPTFGDAMDHAIKINSKG